MNKAEISESLRAALAWIRSYARLTYPYIVEMKAQNALADAGFEVEHLDYSPRVGSPEAANMELLTRAEAAEAKLRAAEEALRQCRVEIERFQHLSYGKTDFPPTKGMELADAILSSSAPTQPKVRIA